MSLFTLSLGSPSPNFWATTNPKTIRRFCFLFLGKLRNTCMGCRQRTLKDHSLRKSLERISRLEIWAGGCAFLSLPSLPSVIACKWEPNDKDPSWYQCSTQGGWTTANPPVFLQLSLQKRRKAPSRSGSTRGGCRWIETQGKVKGLLLNRAQGIWNCERQH